MVKSVAVPFAWKSAAFMNRFGPLVTPEKVRAAGYTDATWGPCLLWVSLKYENLINPAWGFTINAMGERKAVLTYEATFSELRPYAVDSVRVSFAQLCVDPESRVFVTNYNRNFIIS